MSIKPVLVPDQDAATLRKLMDRFAEATTGPTRQELTESRAAVAAAQGVAEAAKWRTHPDAHDHDTDGSPMPKGGIKSDPLSIRQGVSRTQSEKDPKSLAGKFGDKYAKKHGVPTKQLMKNIPLDDIDEPGVAEARPDVMRHRGDTTIRVVKRAGKPIGEIGIDAEASEGNGAYYVKLYDGSYDAVGYDTAEEALAELKYAIKSGVTEGYDSAGAYDKWDPKHPDFVKNYREFQARNPGATLKDFVADLKKGVAEGLDKENRARLRNLIADDTYNFYSLNNRIPKISEFSRSVKSKLNSLEFDERSELYRQGTVQALKLLGKQGVAENSSEKLSRLKASKAAGKSIGDAYSDLKNVKRDEKNSSEKLSRLKASKAAGRSIGDAYSDLKNVKDVAEGIFGDKAGKEINQDSISRLSDKELQQAYKFSNTFNIDPEHAATAKAVRAEIKKRKQSVAEGIMDVVKQAFNDNVAAWPMGTSDEQL